MDTPLEYHARLNAAYETGKALDRAFFEANPRRRIYIRRAVDVEFGQVATDDRPSEFLILVRQSAPRVLTREQLLRVSRGRAKRMLRWTEEQLRDIEYLRDSWHYVLAFPAEMVCREGSAQ